MPYFKDRTGETRIMQNGLRATIVKYHTAAKVDIQFENGSIVTRRYLEFKDGTIRCPMLIEQFGDYARVTNANVVPDFVFYMDVVDLPILGKYLWCNVHGYAHNKIAGGSLHRLIVKAHPGEGVDHINGIAIDNRRNNLRICTQSENAKNVSTRKSTVSGYKGVVWHSQDRKWRARITANKREYELGLFDTPEAAALAYNEAALKYHGEFARLNKISN